MSKLTVYKHREDLQQQQPEGQRAPQPSFSSIDPVVIAATLAEKGIGFERWPAPVNLSSNAEAEEILRAYGPEIARVQANENYQTIDAIRMQPTHPDRVALRQKFLAEHTHAENEVRFFVEGHGLFCLHINDEVLQVLCERNDWISVPAGTKHWFDMGENPEFCAIRFFNNPDGWVAEFSGDQIAKYYPLLESDN